MMSQFSEELKQHKFNEPIKQTFAKQFLNNLQKNNQLDLLNLSLAIN